MMTLNNGLRNHRVNRDTGLVGDVSASTPSAYGWLPSGRLAISTKCNKSNRDSGRYKCLYDIDGLVLVVAD
jgi:hypothetical protein